MHTVCAIRLAAVLTNIAEIAIETCKRLASFDIYESLGLL